jgi:hypothetical protein
MARAKFQSKEPHMTDPTTTPAAPAKKVAEAPVANLRETRKAAAAAKKTTTKAAPATKTAVKTEKPAEGKTVSSKIRWQLDAEKDEKGRAPQHGTSPVTGSTYRVSADGEKWLATVTTPDGVQTVLGQGIGHTAAYGKCVAHAKAAAL